MSINYTASTLAVLQELSKDPTRGMHTRKVAEATRVSTGTASMVLRVLESSGLLLEEDRGNMRLYRFNQANPVARQFKVLFITIWLKPLIDQLSEFTEQVTLYGSAAEGLDTSESDLDLFILTRDVSMVKTVLRRFEARHANDNRRLSPIILNAQGYARMRKYDPALFENISRGRILWERSA